MENASVNANDFELVVAMNMNGCIGSNNTIPWHLPEDLKHFKELTENNIVIMGRKTFESLPNGPLKNRLNIVISSHVDKTYNYPNVIVSNMIDVFDHIKKYRDIYSKVFIIGGSQMYNLFIKYCNKLHITYIIRANIKGDTYFDKSLLNDFSIVNSGNILMSKNKITYMFCNYERTIYGEVK
jgi:dihydrofolate reductase